MDNMIIEAIDTIGRKLDMHNALLEAIAEKLCSEETIQDVIRPDQTGDYLSAGWKYVDSFTDGREHYVVVEIDKKLRR